MGGKPRRKPAHDLHEPLVLALPKGRLLQTAVRFFARAGYDLSSVVSARSRKLDHRCGPLKVWVIRSTDVPTYVDHGIADLGVVGNDVIEEQGRALYVPLDLGFGACRLVVAAPADRIGDSEQDDHLRVATSYPNLTRRYYQSRGVNAEIIELSGAVELGPLAGLADRIVDVVETGETMRQNGLMEVATILDVSARLIVNPARLKLRSGPISQVIDRLARGV